MAIAAIVAGVTVSTEAQAVFSHTSLIARERAQALKSACGPSAPWRGIFSGERVNRLTDEFNSYFDEGCFETERACRVWQGLSITVLDGGPMRVTSCTR